MVLVSAIIALGPGKAGAADSSTLETAIKAAFLSKFALYVDWPRTAFASPESAINLCVVGLDPFGSILDKEVRGQSVENRPIVVRRLPVVTRNSGCHVLFAGGSQAQSIDQVLATVRGAGVLTVTDVPNGSDTAGIVNFIVRDNRVRFTIDDAAAALNGLTISSKLLSIALSAKPRT